MNPCKSPQALDSTQRTDWINHSHLKHQTAQRGQTEWITVSHLKHQIAHRGLLPEPPQVSAQRTDRVNHHQSPQAPNSKQRTDWTIIKSPQMPDSTQRTEWLNEWQYELSNFKPCPPVHCMQLIDQWHHICYRLVSISNFLGEWYQINFSLFFHHKFKKTHGSSHPISEHGSQKKWETFNKDDFNTLRSQFHTTACTVTMVPRRGKMLLRHFFHTTSVITGPYVCTSTHNK